MSSSPRMSRRLCGWIYRSAGGRGRGGGGLVTDEREGGRVFLGYSGLEAFTIVQCLLRRPAFRFDESGGGGGTSRTVVW